jgi:hypothetical protein
MSKTKDYISEMMDKGIDVLTDSNDYDYEYALFLEAEYQKSLQDMNQTFESETETPKSE